VSKTPLYGGITWFVCIAFTFVTTYSLNGMAYKSDPPPIKGVTQTTKGQIDPSLLEAAMNAPKSKRDLLFLIAMTGASIDSLKLIRADLDQRIPESYAFPKIALNNNKIIINGTDLGIRIISTSPMNITYKGRTWVHDANLTIDQNYLSLAKFLSQPSIATTIDLLLPNAHAQSTGLDNNAGDSAAIGGIVGAGILGIIAVLTIPVSAAALALIVIAIGAGAGTTLGWILGKILDKEKVQILNQIVTSGYSIECTSNEVKIKSLSNPSHTLILNKSGSKPKVSIMDEQNKPIGLTFGLSKKESRHYDSLLKCNNEEDAKKLEEPIRKTMENLNAVFHTPKPKPEQVDPAKPIS